MAQLGILLIILGFGTFVLKAFDREFKVLAWAEDYQPWLSIGLGVVGVLLVVGKFLFGRSDDQAPAEASKDA